MNVATPEASVVPWVVVMVGVPAPEDFASVTVLPATPTLLPSFKVTVTVDVVVPSAVTDVGEAATVELAALTAITGFNATQSPPFRMLVDNVADPPPVAPGVAIVCAAAPRDVALVLLRVP